MVEEIIAAIGEPAVIVRILTHLGPIVIGTALAAHRLGLLILSGLDKRLEAFAVDLSPAWLTELTTRY